MPSSVDAAWAEMMASDKESAPRSTVGFVSELTCGAAKEKVKKSKKANRATGTSTKKKSQQSDKADSMEDSAAAVVQAILMKPSAPSLRETATSRGAEGSSCGGGEASALVSQAEAIPPLVRLNSDGEPPSEADLLMHLQRPMQQCADPAVGVRKRALQQLHDCFTSKDQLRDLLPEPTLKACLEELSKPLLKRFEDSSEKCRLLAVNLVAFFISRVGNLLGVLAYLWPAVMRRLSGAHAYDADTSIFVHDPAAHEAWKRGKATNRQDASLAFAAGPDGTGPAVAASSLAGAVEPSEEVRLALLQLVSQSLIEPILIRGSSPQLHPYFHDLILFLQAHLRDPYPLCKLEACRILALLCRHPALNQGMILYALAIARASLPVLRHRHAKVRCGGVQLLRAACCTPYKAKCRGAGTDAIVDLIGYTAEDSIPIAAFYGGHRTVNYLAELTVDAAVSVRLETSRMLAEFITTLPDRYDHRTRVVAYILNAVIDDDPEVVSTAMDALAIAGAEYERENQGDIVERRQYGVDGDARANHLKPLPPPFHAAGRPRLGTRFYVRGCCRRFLKPLVRELTHWRSTARLGSVKLFKTVVIYCEESLTSELHMLLPELCNAFKSFRAEGRSADDVSHHLAEACELLGRFIAPDSYVPFLLPRLRGEQEVLPRGTDADGRALCLVVTSHMLKGSRPQEVAAHATELIACLTDSETAAGSLGGSLESGKDTVLGSQHDLLRFAACVCLWEVVSALRRCHGAAPLSKGRLVSSRHGMEAEVIRACFVWRAHACAANSAQYGQKRISGLHDLAGMHGGGSSHFNSGSGGTARLLRGSVEVNSNGTDGSARVLGQVATATLAQLACVAARDEHPAARRLADILEQRDKATNNGAAVDTATTATAPASVQNQGNTQQAAENGEAEVAVLEAVLVEWLVAHRASDLMGDQAVGGNRALATQHHCDAFWESTHPHHLVVSQLAALLPLHGASSSSNSGQKAAASPAIVAAALEVFLAEARRLLGVNLPVRSILEAEDDMGVELTVQCHQEWARLLLDVMRRLAAAKSISSTTTTNGAPDGSPLTLVSAVAASSVPRLLVGLVAHLALRQPAESESATKLGDSEAIVSSLNSMAVSGELHSRLEPKLDVGTSADLVAALVTLANSKDSSSTTSSWVYKQCFQAPLPARMAMVLAVRTAPDGGLVAPIQSNGVVSPPLALPLPLPPSKSISYVASTASASPQARAFACAALGDLLELGFSGRLKPFKAQMKDAMSTEEVGVGRLPGWRAAAKLSAPALLARLEDGHQEVRIAAANALSSLWPFAAPTDKLTEAYSSSEGSDEWEVVDKSELQAATTRSSEGAWLSLDDLLSACLPLVATQVDPPLSRNTSNSSDQDGNSDDDEGGDDDDGDPTASAVEAALREGAVVDAECFLQAVSHARSTAKAAPRLANLESHGELLASLEAAKAANQKRAKPISSVEIDDEAAVGTNECDVAGPMAPETAEAEKASTEVHNRGSDLEELD